MTSNSLDVTLLKGSIQEIDLTEDVVTERLTARCSERRGEYVNFATRPSQRAANKGI